MGLASESYCKESYYLKGATKMISSRLEGRNFLISGTTGFMGKVLL